MKLKILPIIIILTLLLCSCSMSNGYNHNTDGRDDGITYPKTDTSGTDVIYIITSVGGVPISICKNGHSSLSDENYYYNLQNSIDNDLTLKDKNYTLFTNGGNNCGNVSIDDIVKGKVKQPLLTTIATSSNWKLCPNLKKTVYTDKTADSGYLEFISQSFPDVKDIKICETYEYDIDGDDNNEAIVVAKAKNFTAIVLLSQSMGNSILNTSNTNDDNSCAIPYLIDIDGNGKYSILTITGSGLKTATFYKEDCSGVDQKIYLPIGA